MSDSAPLSFTNTWHPDPQFPAVLERYQILGVIGQGGMGTVFKGYHVNLKRFVAIKTLRIDHVRRPDLVNRFRREMQVIGQMDHPNVVRATDAGEKNGVLYLVMEYLTGSDFSRRLAENGPMALGDACELIRQAALGLDYIHQTLVHRDVKPSNLMLTTAGLVKILDLGLARITVADLADGERTPSACALGTYDYMAPEQAGIGAGASLDGRADVYSLGCTLFKLLVGRAPFSGPEYSSAAKKLYAHCHQPLQSVEGFASIHPPVGEILLRMTAKEPGERYSTAREVANALAPFTAGSQPARLLHNPEDVETPVQTLPRPLPEEISRLTDAQHETPASIPAHFASAPLAGRRLLLGGGLLAGALAAAWFLPPALRRPAGKEQARPSADPPEKKREWTPLSAPRDLDPLRGRTWHRLLEQPPFAPGAADGSRRWRWDENEHLLEVKGDASLMFHLGTTTKSRFTFETVVQQAPWTGRVGVFWGCHEDAAARRARKSGQAFAWFQMLVLWQRIGPMGEAVCMVRRGNGVRAYNDLGETHTSTHFSIQQDVPPLRSGPRILAASVDHNRLAHARFDSTELTRLCSEEVNKTFQTEPYQGSLGLISLSHSAVFSDARFLSQSSD